MVIINKALPLRPATDTAAQEAKLKEASNTYEQHFLQEMVKAMRKTVTPGIEKPSFAESLYREQLDTQYVDSWEKRGGIGLGDMIYQQLHSRFFPSVTKGAFPLHGPLPLQGPMTIKSRTTGQKSDLSFVPETKTPQALTSPWAGEVSQVENGSAGDINLLIKHPELNVESRFSFHGVSSLKSGDLLNAGDNLGTLAGDGKPLFWSVAGVSGDDSTNVQEHV